MSADKHVVLNVNVLNTGIHTGSWRRTDEPPSAFADPGYYVRMAKIAERGTLDALFLADGPALRDHPALRPSQALEPSVILASVAADGAAVVRAPRVDDDHNICDLFQRTDGQRDMCLLVPRQDISHKRDLSRE